MDTIILDAISIVTIYVVGQATGMLLMAVAIWANGMRRKSNEDDNTCEKD